MSSARLVTSLCRRALVFCLLLMPSLAGCELTDAMPGLLPGAGDGIRVIESSADAIGASNDDSEAAGGAETADADSPSAPSVPEDERLDPLCVEVNCPAPWVCFAGGCVSPDDVPDQSHPAGHAPTDVDSPPAAPA